MKALILLLVVICVGCGTPFTGFDLADPNQAKIEKAIRKGTIAANGLHKPTGELTKADLEKMYRLVLNNNQLTDLNPLAKLTQLEMLSLSGNQLTDLKGLEKLTELSVLNLNNNQLTDLNPLAKLTKLTNLRLQYNKVTDVKGLENLTRLTELDLIDNPDLTKAQIAELQKALPNCNILSNPTK